MVDLAGTAPASLLPCDRPNYDHANLLPIFRLKVKLNLTIAFRMQAQPASVEDNASPLGFELWSTATVLARTGLSKSEMYRRRQATDRALNPFPPQRRRPGGKQGVFWASCDVRAWQLAEIGAAEIPYPNWPSQALRPLPTTLAEMLG